MRTLVEPAQLDRIHRKIVGQLVEGRLEREGADGLAVRAHERVGHGVEVHDFLGDPEILGAPEVGGSCGR